MTSLILLPIIYICYPTIKLTRWLYCMLKGLSLCTLKMLSENNTKSPNFLVMFFSTSCPKTSIKKLLTNRISFTNFSQILYLNFTRDFKDHCRKLVANEDFWITTTVISTFRDETWAISLCRASQESYKEYIYWRTSRLVLIVTIRQSRQNKYVNSTIHVCGGTQTFKYLSDQ